MGARFWICAQHMVPCKWLRFAIYPGGASRYIKHVDNTLRTDGRRLTAVLYLNRHWSAEGGPDDHVT